MAVQRQVGRGCIALFALPFAAVGVAVIGWMGWTLVQVVRAQAWVETPARILEANLEGGGKEAMRATARYTYTFAGRPFEGTRVSFYGGADNIGSFQRDVHAELARHVSPAPPEPAGVEVDPHAPTGPLFRCYVNPQQPAEAVLYRNARPGMALFQLLFGGIFGGVGFGLMFGSAIGARLNRKRLALAAQHPGEPWKWRADWASGLVRADRNSARALMAMAVFWNAIAFPVGVLVVPKAVKEGHYVALLALIFPVVGVGLAIAAVRELLRVRRFGGATLKLATIPGVIGGKLAGLLTLPVKVRAEGGFHLKLVCAQSFTTGSGKNRHTEERVLWEDEQILASDALRDPTKTALPVLFAIPFDQPPTDSDASAPVTWRLELKARNPGVDLGLRFELPVFRTAESSPGFKLDDAPIRPFLAPVSPGEELRAARVRIEETPRGAAFIFPPARFPGQAVAVTLFALVWTGAVVGMIMARRRGHGPPWWFIAIFAGFDLLVLWGVLDAWFGSGRIDVERGTLRWRRGLFGAGRPGSLGAGRIREFAAVSASQSGNTLRYAVSVVDDAGRRTTISRELPGKRSAEALIAEIQRVLRRG